MPYKDLVASMMNDNKKKLKGTNNKNWQSQDKHSIFTKPSKKTKKRKGGN